MTGKGKEDPSSSAFLRARGGSSALISKLEAEMSEMRAKLDIWRGKYYEAVHYIRQLHLAYPDAVDANPVADELEQDF
ncbi:hypothetical protein [Corynebacterium pseudotuberculosis]|uniref:hypothetical protein n=1 Tax=Corynebacterium pseudotuberculosis TaxID=1719 RepID=UPI000B49B23D